MKIQSLLDEGPAAAAEEDGGGGGGETTKNEEILFFQKLKRIGKLEYTVNRYR